MPDKSPHKTTVKKQGKSLKEKRATKRSKKSPRSEITSIIPPTGR